MAIVFASLHVAIMPPCVGGEIMSTTANIPTGLSSLNLTKSVHEHTYYVFFKPRLQGLGWLRVYGRLWSLVVMVLQALQGWDTPGLPVWQGLNMQETLALSNPDIGKPQQG